VIGTACSASGSDAACSRRRFLTVGGLALGGFSLSSLFKQ